MNYFPYLAFLKHIKTEIKKELDKSNPSFLILEKYLEHYQNNIKTLYKNFEWCKDNDFQAYVLNKKLSQISYQLPTYGNIMLFVASSFILPINYKKVNREIDDLKNSINEYETHIPLLKRILEEEQQIKNTQQDIEKRDRNQIEILGIFAAVVLFAAGGINIFKESPSIEQSAKFGLIFSYSLSIFVILIWLITRDYRHFKPSPIHFIIVIIFAIATYLVFAIAFYYWPFTKLL